MKKFYSIYIKFILNKLAKWKKSFIMYHFEERIGNQNFYTLIRVQSLCTIILYSLLNFSYLYSCHRLHFHIRWPNDWSFSTSPFNEYSRFISFTIDWFDLLTVQGILKSPLQHYSSKASVLLHPAFFMVQLSHLYMTTGKTIALTRWTFVDKVTSLLFNMLSRFVIAFLPRTNHLLISWLQSPSAVILEPKEIKCITVSIVFPSICHGVMGPDAMIFIF